MNIDAVFLRRFLSIWQKGILLREPLLRDPDVFCEFKYYYGLTNYRPLTLVVLYGDDSYYFDMGNTRVLDSKRNRYIVNELGITFTDIGKAIADGAWIEPTDVDVLEFIDDYCLEESE